MSSKLRPVALFLIGSFFMLAAKSRLGWYQWDFIAYLNAAKAIRNGENPYADPSDPFLQNITVLTRYVYPPLFARVLAPFSIFPESVLRFGWLAVHALASETLYWLGLRLFGKKFGWGSWLLFHAIGVRYDGVETDFRAGNTALMEAAVITAWAAFREKTPVRAGIGLGTLVSVKPLCVFVAVSDLADRRWRSCLAFGATVVFLVGLMVLDPPLFSQYREFIHSRAFQEIMDEHTVGIFNNATVSVAFRLFTDKTMFVPLVVFPPLAYALTFLVPVLGWLAFFQLGDRLRTSPVPESVKNGCGFALLLPTVLLTTPRVADYTLVWLLVPLFFETWRALRDRCGEALFWYLLAGLVGNLTITGGQLDPDTFQLHWLHFRYASLVLFWMAAYRTGWITVRRYRSESVFSGGGSRTRPSGSPRRHPR